MSYAEKEAHRLYDTMNLNSIGADVQRQLMILMLSRIDKVLDVLDEFPDADDVEYDTSPLPEFNTYEQAVALGAVDIKTFNREMLEYIDNLCRNYNIK